MKKFLRLICIFATCTLLAACAKDTPGKEQGDPDEPYMTVDVTKVDFMRIASSQSFAVDTNIEEVECDVSNKDWCRAVYLNGTVTVEVDTHDGASNRNALITLKAEADGEKITRRVTVNQNGKNASVAMIPEDVKIAVSSSEVAPAANSAGEGIDKSHDGNSSTVYHSRYSQVVSPSDPVTITYTFANVATMDYLVYVPRTEGVNGNFKEFELWVSTTADPVLKKYGDYDFEGRGSASTITFSPALQNPRQVRFIVKSGYGDSQGTSYASCAEMQFFKRGDLTFDPLTVFTDVTCSALKPGVGKAAIDAIENVFYKELATELMGGKYESEFRVANFKVWQHPDVMAKANKTGTYSLRDNPTGIYVRSGDQLIVMADMKGASASLIVQDPKKRISGSSYALKTGVNKYKITNDGLIYVMYHNRTGEGPEVKLHFVTGNVNGYFDSQKHAKERWSELLGKAAFEHFDLVGKYAHLTMQTSAFRASTPDGLALVNKYDDMVRLEQEFIGLFKYDKVFKNRMYFIVDEQDPGSYMFKTNYLTGYHPDTQSGSPGILKLANFSTSAIWGPAHEVGHVNQTAGFKWHGMTEVSNNVYSMYIQTEFGNRSRLLEGAYTKAFAQIVDAKISYMEHDDVFCRLVPFWQLKLYMHNVLGDHDFYKDLHEELRLRATPATHGESQMGFVKIACDVSKLDLAEFFEAWGFFKVVSLSINDYGEATFAVTQSMIDEAKAYIAAKGYPKPAHDFTKITDDNVANYK